MGFPQLGTGKGPKILHHREVTWTLPVPLYTELRTLQESLKGKDGLRKWATVEALAIHFLMVAAREARKEIAQKQQQSRLVQPAMMQPSIIIPGETRRRGQGIVKGFWHFPFFGGQESP